MFEIEDSVVDKNSGRKGILRGIGKERVPRYAVEWKDGSTTWVPNDSLQLDAQAGIGRAAYTFRQSNGDVTKAYYASLNAKGLLGQLAVALFRAQKRSIAAKKYKKSRFRRDAYSVKNWSISEVCRILDTMTDFEMAPRWGWKHDPKTPKYEWVLYVDLPTGQCSFHLPSRLNGPDYTGMWDGVGMSVERICRYCDLVDEG